MEELLLHTLFSGEELYIVDKEQVSVAVFLVEVGDKLVFKSLDKVISESLTGNVDDIEIRVVLLYFLGDSGDEVGLAHTGRAVDKQRIIAGYFLFAAVLGD